MQRHHVIREQRILEEIRPVDENKDQVEAGEEGGTQLQILRHCLGAVVVAANRVGRSQYRCPKEYTGAVSEDSWTLSWRGCSGRQLG